MDDTSMSIEDMESFEIAKYTIEKELSDLKKIVDHLSEMRGIYYFLYKIINYILFLDK